MATRDQIISEIKRLAAETGKPPGKTTFAKATGIKESAWSGRYWARWSDALQEAGFRPNVMAEAYTDQVLAECLAEIVEHLGHWPTHAELRLYLRERPEWPSHNAFTRVGTQYDQARVVVDNADALGLSPEVVVIAEAKVKSAPQRSATAASPVVSGFVYLLKSGPHYKVGRTNSPGRREYEIDLVMPEKVRLVHEIATDDPPGIEAYWHRRFAERRRRGEWFDLTADDIAAFKSRDSM